MPLLNSLARRLPAIAWRDARLAELLGERDALRQEAKNLRRQLSRTTTPSRAAAPPDAAGPELEIAHAHRAPSFLAHYSAYKRQTNRAWRTDPGDVRVGMNRKLRMYQLAQSHGVAVPEILGLWATPEEIDWESLPDRFVVKSDGGSAGQGVFPLVREDGAYRVIGEKKLRTAEDVVGLLRRRADENRLKPPYFVEGLLEDARYPGALPDDIKIYCFYGEVGHVLLRSMTKHAQRSSARWRYLDERGEDLGPVSLDVRATPDVPVPGRLPEMVDIARRLSTAVPLPFIRVDLYDLEDRVVFGELTLVPGGTQHYTQEHDKRLGSLWEAAEARLLKDLRAGASWTLRPGPEPVTSPGVDMVGP